MSSKKRKSEPGCIATIFGYTILACIVFTIFNLAKTHLSTKAKIIILSVIGILLILKIFGFFNRKYTMSQLDNMEGHRFEFACADILKMNGFYDVKVTQGSGDYGVDIIARKGMRKYAIQCKCYSHKLDNKPIQEVIGGLAYYGCNKGVVMTNQYFTEPAKQLAKVNGIELWDRNVLSRMTKRTSKIKMRLKKKEHLQEHNPSSKAKQPVTETNSFQIYSTPKYAEKVTMMNDLDDYPRICKKFLKENAEYIVCYYKMTFDVVLKLEKIDVLYKQNSVSFEFLHTPQLPVSKLKKSLKDLSEYISIDNISLHSSCTTPGCFAIQMPMPDYLAKTSRFIDKNSK